jgi:tRNA pseudouridine13 synthase
VIPDHWRRVALEPPRAWGGSPLLGGVLRATPEDFVVDEVLGFEAGGDGPHALLHVRKRGANTEWVARELARAAGCKPFDVGFAGLKDRNAVTTQYFTVPRGKRASQDFIGLAGEGYEVIGAAPHQRKLPRGALAGNRFEITVRGVSGDTAALAARLADIARGGVPNYFGAQRFGRDAGNLADVLRAAVDTGGATPGRSRGRGDAGFMLSAARSLVFNAILAERVSRGTWNVLQAGDVANLDGRGSVFVVEAVDDALVARCASLEIHPTAPLIGADASLAAGAPRALEEQIAAGFPEALAVIGRERMNSERRALRMRVAGLGHELTGDVLRLRFELAAGSFATTVLREIIAAGDGEQPC